MIVPDLPQTGDLRSLPSDFDATELVQALSSSAVVLATCADGSKRDLLKGREVLERIVKAGQNEKHSIINLTVANTTQVEMLVAALELIADEKMGSIQIETFGRMIASVSNR